MEKTFFDALRKTGNYEPQFSVEILVEISKNSWPEIRWFFIHNLFQFVLHYFQSAQVQ